MRSALAFLTAFGGAAPADRRAVPWFGVVGAVVGLLVGGVWWGAGELWTPLVAATLAVAADAAFTGMLHLDGLADSADGLLPPLDRQRRLAVMADPHAGVFAVVVVVLVLGLRVAALAALEPEPLLLAGLWGGARAAMGVTLAVVPYARAEGGLATAFGGTSAIPSVVVGLAALGLAAMAGNVGAAVGVVIGASAVVALAARRLGGYTGDVLGAAGIVGETCGLLLVAAEW